jgi:RNA polymerase sigma factor for flagellar operon FliA
LYKCSAERENLISTYLPLVKRIAARMFIPSPEVMDRDDLVSQGMVGLLDAIERFDPTRETCFKSYASRRIRGAMVDAIRSVSFSPRSVNDRIKLLRAAEDKLLMSGEDATEESLAREMELSPEQVREISSHIALRSVMSLDRFLFSAEGDEVAVSAVVGHESSPDPESVVEAVELKAALAGALADLPERDQQIISLYYVEEMTLKEIAAVLGVTEGRVSQLHSRALLRLRSLLTDFMPGR